MLPMLRIVLLLLLATVQGQTVDQITEHRCHGSAWVADGNRFRYTKTRKPILSKMLINDQWVYAYSTDFREGQTLHIDAGFNFKNKYGVNNFEFNILGGAPVVKERGADVLHLKFNNRKQYQPFEAPSRNSTTYLSLTANTLKNNKWMIPVEVNEKYNGDNFFSLTITALSNEFEVRLFGLILLQYSYRLPLDYVQFVNALGQIDIFKMYLGGQIMMAPLRAVFPTGGIKPEYNLIIDAIPRSSNFSIAFTDPENKFGIMLLIKVNGDRQTVFLNSRINKSWGKAVRAWSFPFKVGKAFDMEIQFSKRTLTVNVETKELATFDYRALPTFGEMTFDGSLEIRSLTICEPLQGSMHNGDKYSGKLTKKTFSYSKYGP